MYLPSCENATEPTERVCPSRVETIFPLFESQIPIVVSEPNAMRVPQGEYATDIESAFNVKATQPLSTSQILAVLSLEPDTRYLPSGEKATELSGSEHPKGADAGFPLFTSQIRILPSSDPEASRALSGEKVMEVTLRVCPVSLNITSPSGSHIRIVLSAEPEAILDPSGDHATDETHLVCASSGPTIRSPF